MWLLLEAYPCIIKVVPGTPGRLTVGGVMSGTHPRVIESVMAYRRDERILLYPSRLFRHVWI